MKLHEESSCPFPTSDFTLVMHTSIQNSYILNLAKCIQQTFNIKASKSPTPLTFYTLPFLTNTFSISPPLSLYAHLTQPNSIWLYYKWQAAMNLKHETLHNIHINNEQRSLVLHHAIVYLWLNHV